jgi:hypothetical protein
VYEEDAEQQPVQLSIWDEDEGEFVIARSKRSDALFDHIGHQVRLQGRVETLQDELGVYYMIHVSSYQLIASEEDR